MIHLIQLDKSHYRLSEPDTFFTKDNKLFKRVGCDEVFVEDILFQVWKDYDLQELELDKAIEDMALYGHPIAIFNENGIYYYTITKEEYEHV